MCFSYTLSAVPSGNFIFLINFCWSLVALQCCASFYCTAKWINYRFTYIPSFWISFPFRLPQEHWVEFPALYNGFSLVIYFIHCSVYMTIPISQYIPPPPPFSPLDAKCFFQPTSGSKSLMTKREWKTYCNYSPGKHVLPVNSYKCNTGHQLCFYLRWTTYLLKYYMGICLPEKSSLFIWN